MSVYNIPFDTHQDLIEYLDENEPDQYAVYKHEDEDEGIVWLYSSPVPTED